MQTFLPYASFRKSAKVLDYRRLGKQRVETKQILAALRKESAGWANHPASLMWAGHETALARYGMRICQEWRSRGYKDTLLPFFEERSSGKIIMPPWFGMRKFHASHRSNLLRKDATHYSQFGWTEPDNLPYYWPLKESK